MTAAIETHPDTAARPRWFRRAWEWLWRGQALSQARAARAGVANLHADERARVSAEVAEKILAPASPWLSGKAHHLAAALFVESIGWALRAVGSSDQASDPQRSFLGPPTRAELEQLLNEHEPQLLAIAPGRAQLDRLRGLLLERTFESSAIPDGEAEVAAHLLAGATRRLLELNRRAQPSLDALFLQRTVRVGGLALLLVLASAVRPLTRTWLEPRADLAAGKPWRASSASTEPACTSPSQSCTAGRDFFFHTQEELNPWIEIDLGRPQQVSRVRVINRQDCCAERAVPLVIELSGDQRTWRQVAEHAEPFDSWLAAFKAQPARWVRVRVPRRSFLHLYRVRVLP